MRPLRISTPLGKDVFLAVRFEGTEGISQLFHYTIDVVTPVANPIPIHEVIGQPISIALDLPLGGKRFFHGLCNRMSQCESDKVFTKYRIEIVPQFWLLTKRAQSRIYQNINVPAILKDVFKGLDVDDRLTGKFEKRDYCAQYRESDFNFASRMMEEEGIFYYFEYSENKHVMVLGNAPQTHPTVPGKVVIAYQSVSEEASTGEDHITELFKVQELTSNKVTLRDHTFELPHLHNAAEKEIPASVTVGKVEHKLKTEVNEVLEVYDWPGEYAQRFDGIDSGGNEQPGEVKKISEDSKRTTDLRMKQIATGSVRIQGSGSARQMTSGHKFTLATRSQDYVATPLKAEGDYVITSVRHESQLPANYRSEQGGTGFRYTNSFTSIPAALPYLPPRIAQKPIVSGSQTAVVVGPPGEEIFTDKYGRIKVQFHWDRYGKNDAKSSCWVRVAQISAGRFWGALSIPRIGQEVVIDFLGGDPDQPICIGCVYNPDQMPRYKLPDEKTKSYIRTNSTMGGVGYNELCFEDKAGKEQVYIHAQRNLDERVRNDSLERIGNNRHLRVGFYLENDHKGETGNEAKKGSQYEEVAIDQHLKVHNNKDEQVGGNMKLLVGGGDGDGNLDIHVKKDQKVLIDGNSDLHVQAAVRESIDGTYDLTVKESAHETIKGSFDQHVTGEQILSIDSNAHLTVGGSRNEKVTGALSQSVLKFDHKSSTSVAIEAGTIVHLKAGVNLVIEAPVLTLKGSGGFVNISPAGVAISGTMVLINSGGVAGAGPGASPADPKTATDAKAALDAVDAKPVQPMDAAFSKTGDKSSK